MARRLFAVVNVLIIVMLVLAAVALTVASLISRSNAGLCSLYSWKASDGVPELDIGFEQPFGRPWIRVTIDAPKGGPNCTEKFWYVAGVWYETRKYNCGIREFVIHTPLWMPLALLCAYPASWLVLRRPLRQYYRRKHGLCPKCSYDLTGNESGICPECGNEVKV